MSANAESAVAMFGQGHNCAQSVLACFGKELGLSSETALRIALPFGGGMGRTGNVCGAVTGALMVLGLQCTQAGINDAAKAQAHRLAQEFLRTFAAENGSITCRDLIGCDITTDEGLRLAKQFGKLRVCPQLVRSAVEIVERMTNPTGKQP